MQKKSVIKWLKYEITLDIMGKSINLGGRFMYYHFMDSPWPRGFSVNGSLHLDGVSLCGATGLPVRLRGMSTFGMQYKPQFASRGSVEEIKKRGANLLRVAMYTHEGGYIDNPEKMEEATFAAVDTALDLDMYAIIDWHILRDGNPNQNKDAAKAFFDRAAARYARNGAVLYEICNEPNGDVTWGRDILPYANEIIPIIRAHARNAVILVGTPSWSSDVDAPVRGPLEFDNVMYTCHFYAGSHGREVRKKIDRALSKGLPVFVSEWGVSKADGSGGVFLKEAEAWLDFLDKRGISWANWSLSDMDETSAALKPGVSPDGGWNENDLSESGRFVFSRF